MVTDKKIHFERGGGGGGYLEFSASVELAETLHRFLSVHHGRHRGAMLRDKRTECHRSIPGLSGGDGGGGHSRRSRGA